MATVNPTVTTIGSGDDQVVKFSWALTSTNADGAPVGPQYADYADRTVYFLGTWGGATAKWQGGDNSTWLDLSDPQGNPITKTADAIEVVSEMPEFARPNLTTAGSGAAITAVCVARRGFRRS